MPRTNGELLRYVGHMTETSHENILGFVLVSVMADKRIAVLSNGNAAQIIDLLTGAIEEVAKREGITNASVPDTANAEPELRGVESPE